MITISQSNQRLGEERNRPPRRRNPMKSPALLAVLAGLLAYSGAPPWLKPSITTMPQRGLFLLPRDSVQKKAR